MNVKELIVKLYPIYKKNKEADILLSSDEELNTMFKDIEVAELTDMGKETYVIWGNSGSEVDEF